MHVGGTLMILITAREAKKRRTFTFREEDIVSEGFFDNIVEELKAFSVLQRPGIPSFH